MSGKRCSSKTVKGPLNTTFLHTHTHTQSGLIVSIFKHIPSTSKPQLLFTTKTSGLSTDSVLCNTPEDQRAAVFHSVIIVTSQPLWTLFYNISTAKLNDVTKATTICGMKEKRKPEESILWSSEYFPWADLQLVFCENPSDEISFR